MPRRVISNQVDYSKTIIRTEHGGTGKRTAQEASNEIGLVTQSMVEADNSFFKLGPAAQVKIGNLPPDIQTICNTVTGILSMSVNSSANFAIVDYDAYTNYTVVAVAGSVSRNGNTVTYNSPSSGGTHGFTINGKLYPITVVGASVAKATIVTPVNNATGLGPSLNVTTNAFSISGATDTYSATELEIATDVGFMNKVVTNSQNGTSFNVILPDTNQDYYIRARHKGVTYGYGSWSDATHIVSKTEFTVGTEFAKLIGSGDSGAQFGNCVAISADGTIAVIGAFSEQNEQGRVYVYQLVNGTWTLRQTLAQETTDNIKFGYTLAVNTNGTTIVVGVPNGNTSISANTGCVYVYEKTGQTWNNSAKLWANDIAAYSSYGDGLALSYDGTRLVVAASRFGGGAGKLYVYDKINSVWTNVAGIVPPTEAIPVTFNGRIALSKDGTKLVAGNSQWNNSSGRAYLFDGNNNWSMVATLNKPTENDPEAITNAQFGFDVSISGNGEIIAVSAYTESVGTPGAAQGAVYLFTKADGSNWNSSNWSQVNRITEDELNPNSAYGYCVQLSLDGTQLYVGAPHTDFYGNDSGRVYAYEITGIGQWVKRSHIQASDKETNAYFGNDIAISENKQTLIVGSVAATVNMQNQSGAAYLFK